MIYLDTCVVVYAFEDQGARGDRVRSRLAEHEARGFAISSLVKLESLVGPKKAADSVLLSYYERGLSQFALIALSDAVVLRAADLRADYGLKTPDALHLAAALLGGCEELWTNDRRFSRAVGDFAVAVG